MFNSKPLTSQRVPFEWKEEVKDARPFTTERGTLGKKEEMKIYGVNGCENVCLNFKEEYACEILYLSFCS